MHVYFSSLQALAFTSSGSESVVWTHTWVKDFELSTGNCEQSPSPLSALVQKCISLHAEVFPSAPFFTHLETVLSVTGYGEQSNVASPQLVSSSGLWTSVHLNYSIHKVSGSVAGFSVHVFPSASA